MTGAPGAVERHEAPHRFLGGLLHLGSGYAYPHGAEPSTPCKDLSHLSHVAVKRENGTPTNTEVKQ
jgi:hypothetical protein